MNPNYYPKSFRCEPGAARTDGAGKPAARPLARAPRLLSLLLLRWSPRGSREEPELPPVALPCPSSLL